MLRNSSILAAAVLVIALPFVFRRDAEVSDWKPGDPELVIVSPHNEAIRYEFGRAFSAWHRERYGRPVRIDWRAIGGTTEISRYLSAEFVSAMRGWWTGQGKPWPQGASTVILDRKFDATTPPATNTAAWERLREPYLAFRSTDDPTKFSARIDLFFGGGEYDHQKAFQEGLTVPPWPPGQEPAGLFAGADGTALIPDRIAGETWRTATFFGTAVSTFGICYNRERLADLGIASAPERWMDLADPRYFRLLGVADPTKSGSIAKAFELIIHQQCHDALAAAGFDDAQIEANEKRIAAAKLPGGAIPEDVPPAYQAAIERGWMEGVRLVQRIGANARYFTDSASKVPIDVASGSAAAGIAIDFYARFQAQVSRDAEGRERMEYLTPVGGSGVSCDPIGLLRGAEHRETAVRFIEFVLSDEGQKLWTYRPGTPGGPERYALRRIPIRRSFYASDVPGLQATHKAYAGYAADDLGSPLIDPYALARHFTYYSRWTGRHFGPHRDLIRAMCIDSAEELQDAWRAIHTCKDPVKQEAALRILGELPDRPQPLTWSSILETTRSMDRIDVLRAWTVFFRENYRRAKEAAL